MAYQDFNGTGSTQTSDERAAEAKRILERLRPTIQAAADEDYVPHGLTHNAWDFLWQTFSGYDLTDRVDLTPKQMWFLRDIAEKFD